VEIYKGFSALDIDWKHTIKYFKSKPKKSYIQWCWSGGNLSTLSKDISFAIHSLHGKTLKQLVLNWWLIHFLDSYLYNVFWTWLFFLAELIYRIGFFIFCTKNYISWSKVRHPLFFPSGVTNFVVAIFVYWYKIPSLTLLQPLIDEGINHYIFPLDSNHTFLTCK